MQIAKAIGKAEQHRCIAHVRPSWDCNQRFGECVDVAGNDNNGCASPVHHGHGIWRHFTPALAERQPLG